MDNGESPGIQEPSSASTCSQSGDLGRAGMETSDGTLSAVCGLRTMEPENNLMAPARGSLAIWCAEKLILLFFIIFSSNQKQRL